MYIGIFTGTCTVEDVLYIYCSISKNLEFYWWETDQLAISVTKDLNTGLNCTMNKSVQCEERRLEPRAFKLQVSACNCPATLPLPIWCPI